MPSRNAPRDREVSKQVVDFLNVLDLRMPSGSAEIWKNKYFMEYKVGVMYRDAKYVLCTACLQQKDYHLARICRAANKKERGTTNARQSAFITMTSSKICVYANVVWRILREAQVK